MLVLSKNNRVQNNINIDVKNHHTTEVDKFHEVNNNRDRSEKKKKKKKKTE